MSIVGRLLGTRDARPFMLFGLALATLAQWVMVGWNDDVSGGAIALNGVLQGFGLGFVFTPLNTVAFSTLPKELRTEATGLWTLVRNIGASIGISILDRSTGQRHRLLPQPDRRARDAVQRRDEPAQRGSARATTACAASPCSTGSRPSRRR